MNGFIFYLTNDYVIINERKRGEGQSPCSYLFFLDLLDFFLLFVLTIRQMAVTIAKKASERSFIISLVSGVVRHSSFL